MKQKPLPPLALLLANFRYEPESGLLYYRRNCGPRGKIGTVAGHKKKGGEPSYVVLCYEGALFKAHRVAWAMWHGYDPGEMLIDHINGDGTDNRADNLRLATPWQNSVNSARNTRCSSMRGIIKTRGGKWYARISVLGVRHRVGCFDTKEEAASAYAEAAKAHYGDFAFDKVKRSQQ